MAFGDSLFFEIPISEPDSSALRLLDEDFGSIGPIEHVYGDEGLAALSPDSLTVRPFSYENPAIDRVLD